MALLIRGNQGSCGAQAGEEDRDSEGDAVVEKAPAVRGWRKKTGILDFEGYAAVKEVIVVHGQRKKTGNE